MFKNLSILNKQLIGFSVCTIISLLIGIIGYGAIETQKYQIERIVKTAPLIDAAMEMKISVTKDILMTMQMLYSLNKSGVDELWRKHLEISKSFDLYSTAIISGADTPEGYIYATKDDRLRNIAHQANTFHDDKLQPTIETIYKQLSDSFNGSASGAASLEELEQEVHKIGEQMLELLGSVEDLAKVQINSAQENAKKMSTKAELFMVVAILTGIAISLILGFFIARLITQPIKKAVLYAQSLASGDLGQQLNITQTDEIGTLGLVLTKMATHLKEVIGDISMGVQMLTSSSTELSSISEQMSQGSESASHRCSSVASATEQMSANMVSVAAATDQSSTNIHMVASAAEEMSATVSEIAKSSAQASAVTATAVSKSSTTTSIVYDLGTSAKKISKVTEVITEISEQTNLLALNATIEAARAGEAGKGFAVVANEIKELAKQTAEATSEIKARIDDIQKATTMTVTDIEDISQVINDVNEFVSTIAAAAEEQSVSTQDIVQNIAHASQGIKEVNENIRQTSTVSSEIASEINGVSQSNSELTNSSAQILSSVSELSRLAEHLTVITQKFRL